MKRTRKPRGLAVIAVVMMLVLLSMTVTALAMVFATQARRTRAAVDGMQLRQLLMAAEPAARAYLAAQAPTTRVVAVPLPAALATVDKPALSLHVTIVDATHATMRAMAEFRGQKATQLMMFTQDGSTWKLTNAVLENLPS